MVVGASVASANTAAATSNAYSAGVAAGSANTTAAYSAGVAAGSANTAAAYNAGVAAAPAQVVYVPAGAVSPTLPPGAMAINKDGATYYLSGNTWYQPSYGANGVFYKVVPAP